jgi:hypothetical protein
MTADEKKLEYLLLNLYHVFIVTPVAIYIGLNGDKASNTSIIFLFVNFMFAFIYHIVRVLRRFNGISMGHVIFSLVGGGYLLLSKRPTWFYYSIIGLGGYAGIKHGYELMLKSH